MKKILLSIILVSLTYLGINAQCMGGLSIESVLLDPNGSNNNFDTDGNGSAVARDEFVEVCNTSGATIDLSTVTLSDDDGNSSTLSGSLADGDCIFIVADWDESSNPVPVGVIDLNRSNFINNGGDLLTLTLNGTIVCQVAAGGESCGTAVECIDFPSDEDGCVNRAGGNTNCGETLLALLPVELTSFSAIENNNQAFLSWTTASELNNSHFDIEYSIDGTSFRAIDEVTGNGTTQLKQEYSYTHTSPVKGNNYYRLKQIDFDGAFEYSDIVVVKIERTGKIVINPSAAIAEITVQLAETTGENNLIGIYDMMGRTVMMSNFDDTLNEKTIDISSLQKGYYVVRVQAGSEVFTKRFMKMVD